MQHLLIASVLLSFFSLSTTAAELEQSHLVSVESIYLQSLVEVQTKERETVTAKQPTELQLEYADQYDRSVLTLGELDIERKITLNGGGKTLNTDAFELGFHIAVNYTP